MRFRTWASRPFSVASNSGGAFRTSHTFSGLGFGVFHVVFYRWSCLKVRASTQEGFTGLDVMGTQGSRTSGIHEGPAESASFVIILRKWVPFRVMSRLSRRLHIPTCSRDSSHCRTLRGSMCLGSGTRRVLSLEIPFHLRICGDVAT